MLTRLRVVGPLVGRLCTKMPPQLKLPFGPFPLMVAFLMSKAAPLSKMPPPGLPVTAQVSMWRVTVEPVPGVALMPMPVARLELPWTVRLRK